MAKAYQCDVAIVGGGIAGVITALQLLDAGKRVAIFEREGESRFGGSALEAFGGMFFVDSPEQRRMKIADSVEQLHSDDNAIDKETALDENGNMVNGRGDTPNRHDILTGSLPDGTLAADQTCGDWTMSGAEGAAMVGHHDRMGLRDDEPSRSWNSSHPSRGGCSQEALRSTGGDGLFYCFAAN